MAVRGSRSSSTTQKNQKPNPSSQKQTIKIESEGDQRKKHGRI